MSDAAPGPARKWLGIIAVVLVAVTVWLTVERRSAAPEPPVVVLP